MQRSTMMVGVFRLTTGHVNPAAVLQVSDQGTVRIDVLDDGVEPIVKAWLEDGVWSSHLDRPATADDGNAFLEAVVEALGTSSYWGADWLPARREIPAYFSDVVGAGQGMP